MMDLKPRLRILFILILLSGSFYQKAAAQSITIRGTVYDITAQRPLEAVGVVSSSGKGTITDSLGHYAITVSMKDSIWFSLIGKTTMKYPVDTIGNPDNFNVMIHLRAALLPEVRVRNNYYKLDSIQNRQDYAKVFNFKKPTLRLSADPNYNPGGLSVGFDLDEIINLFRTKRNRSILSLQKRLIEEEERKYVDSRYTKQFVRKITHLAAPELDSFMVKYRPEYGVVRLLNDLELGYYVEQCYEQYKATRYRWEGGLRRKDE